MSENDAPEGTCPVRHSRVQRFADIYRHWISPHKTPPILVVKPNSSRSPLSTVDDWPNDRFARSTHEFEMLARVINHLANPGMRIPGKLDFQNRYCAFQFMRSRTYVYLLVPYLAPRVCPTTPAQGLGGVRQPCAAAVKIACGPQPRAITSCRLFSARQDY